MCVCVSEREGGREGGREGESGGMGRNTVEQSYIHIPGIFLETFEWCVCVWEVDSYEGQVAMNVIALVPANGEDIF